MEAHTRDCDSHRYLFPEPLTPLPALADSQAYLPSRILIGLSIRIAFPSPICLSPAWLLAIRYSHGFGKVQSTITLPAWLLAIDRIHLSNQVQSSLVYT
jgi:hypothetical protein